MINVFFTDIIYFIQKKWHIHLIYLIIYQFIQSKLKLLLEKLEIEKSNEIVLNDV